MAQENQRGITSPTTSGKEFTSLFRICCCCSAAQSCPALCNFMKIGRQAPPSMGFPRQEHWKGLPFPYPGDFPDPGMKPTSLTLAGGFFTAEPWRNPIQICTLMLSLCMVIVCFLSFPQSSLRTGHTTQLASYP